MSWVATWFVFELIGVGVAPNPSEPQTFKNVSLQMFAHRAFTFRLMFYKKLYHIQVFDVRYEWPT